MPPFDMNEYLNRRFSNSPKQDAIQNALGAEKAGMPETAEFWDILADEYKEKTDEEITFKMITRGIRRNG